MEKEIKLDKKDRRILSELDKNSRQTDSEISKKVGLSKQVVNYRIQNLTKAKIIENFYTIANIGRLGLDSYYVFFSFKNLNKSSEKSLLEKISKISQVGWLVSGTGSWDAIALVYTPSINNFSKTLDKIIKICGKNLGEYNFTALLKAEHIGYKFLQENQKKEKITQTKKILAKKFDPIDKKILEKISQNARISIVDLSKKIKEPLHKTKYHLKKMIKEKLIEGFKPKINVSKTGLQWYLVLLSYQITSDKRKEEFLKFCESHKEIYYLTTTIGKYNATLDIHVENIKKFKEFLLELREKFPDLIKSYESMTIFEEHKIDYFPKDLV